MGNFSTILNSAAPTFQTFLMLPSDVIPQFAHVSHCNDLFHWPRMIDHSPQVFVTASHIVVVDITKFKILSAQGGIVHTV